MNGKNEVEIDEPEVDEPVSVTEESKPRKRSRSKASAKKKEAKKPVAKADPQPKQNGVRMPGPGLCRQAWDIFDRLSKKGKATPNLKKALEIGKDKGLNLGNVKAEFYAYRRFHGLSGKQA